jgi:DNA-binding MurR/RpiR family transcriptional regulator
VTGAIEITRAGAPLANAAEIGSPIAIPEDHNALTPTPSRDAHMVVIDTLATGVAPAMGARSRK